MGKRKKIKPKDVDLEEEGANLQPSPIPLYPRPFYKKKNPGILRAEKEQKRRDKEEYPGVRNAVKR